MQRLKNVPGSLQMEIVLRLQEMLHEHHCYVRDIKCALEKMRAQEDYRVVIRPDKRPTGEHERRYNAPTTNEVAIILIGENHGNRDIVLQRRSGQLQRIPETHRSYDCLQYPLIFWEGQDGYNLGLK